MEEKKIVRSVRNEDKEKGMKEGRKEGEGWRSGKGGIIEENGVCEKTKAWTREWNFEVARREISMDGCTYVRYVRTYVCIYCIYVYVSVST